MPITVTMPRLSDTMEQGTVVKWHVKEGDAVNSGDVLADIETDKATMELESFDSGTVAKVASAEGEKVDVGATILVIAEEGEDVSEAAASAGAAAAPAQKAEGATETPAPSAPAATATEAPPAAPAPEPAPPPASTNGTAPGGRVFASPLAKKIAAERGLDLSTINGTGPGGRIVRKDVESAPAVGAAPAPAAAPAAAAPLPVPDAGAALEDRTVTLTNMRETIAKRLVESKTTIPHYQVTVSVRLDALMELRTQLNSQLESQGVKLSVNDFLVRACALAMHKHPYVNSSWNPSGPSIDLHGRVNIGVAVALPEERGGGLVVATLRDSDRTGLRQISAETKRLAKKARDKGLTIEEMSDSTFTISNLGMFGVDHFTAIVNPPNAAILAVGRAVEKPFVEYDEDGEPVLTVGHEMSMTMSSDHRIIDGAMAAQYLGTVKELLENPASLLV
jgi:pyruvate dehydrogenase E2 component (dihydrolipoamide acetyltransferase)